jgi:hypothetical protein
MYKPITTLLLVLLLLVGSTSYADARSGRSGFHGGRHDGFHGRGHGGFHGRRHDGRHDGFHGRGFGHRHFIPHHRFGHIHRSHPHFHGGVFFDVSPLWVTPAPYIGITPAPPPPPVWYYCTDPPGYYPTVPACTVPWIPVAPSG